MKCRSTHGRTHRLGMRSTKMVTLLVLAAVRLRAGCFASRKALERHGTSLDLVAKIVPVAMKCRERSWAGLGQMVLEAIWRLRDRTAE